MADTTGRKGAPPQGRGGDARLVEGASRARAAGARAHCRRGPVSTRRPGGDAEARADRGSFYEVRIAEVKCYNNSDPAFK